MLQHNNNNNHPCLDVAHRELLHGCKRGGATFSSALGFNAIPLIKGLRAWAVSGGYSRSRKKAAAASQVSEPLHEGQIGTTHRKTHNSVGSFRTPRVRQGGPGALLTVATLKDSDGGRQTQTRCLFLKADGESYLCTMRTRATDRRSGRGGQESVGGCDAKPQAVRKWRKPSKKPKSADNIAGAKDKKDPVVKCQQAKQSHTSTSSVEVHHGKDHIDGCEATTDTFTSKNNHSIRVGEDDTLESSLKHHSSEDRMVHDLSISTKEETTETLRDLYHVPKSTESGTTISHSHSETSDTIESEIDILQNENLNKPSVSEVLGSEELCLEPNKPVQDTSNKNKTLFTISYGHQDKDKDGTSLAVISSCYKETSITALSRNSLDDSLKEHKDKHELNTRIEDSALNINGEREKYEIINVNNEDNLASFPQDKADIDTRSDIGNAVNTNTKQLQLANSSSQGSSMSRSTGEATPPSNLPNPNSLKSLISQDEEGVEGERLALTPDTELLAKKDLVQDKNKVANKGTGTVDEEEEDEFGFFMKAGDEQIWNKGSNELRIVPCEKQDDMDYSDANEPPSWASDWTEGLPINQSGSSWTAFKQDSRELETECWFSSAVENANLTKSSLINVFSGAFPTVIQPCEDSEFVPTLKELLQAPEQRNRTVQEGTQSLLYGLQDLDHMIGLKYKRAESLSRKLLLQSLHLSAVISDREACGRKPNTARFSPNLPTSNQQLAANAKRRLSYDINRNINP